ncbi:hypothetical protein Emin_0104 [Elusimicrobium minutum Pei191]|uniref:Lipoprotein n=1 Tax=Elusimicrobium minutum (strain Pei191) TaxID=445932 RepID=B2KAX4_ELUMP|nr:hypothetical protein [Elusimicrobium minutum]ACC97670.1 hypothetical protein Emin_0104 [Elusimicrobium minutum Pei191]
MKVKLFIFILFSALLLNACGKKDKEEKISSQECMRQTTFMGNTFFNDCLGLSFVSTAPFLYEQNTLGAQEFFFSVPEHKYDLSVSLLDSSEISLDNDEAKKHFADTSKALFNLNSPDFEIMKEEYTTIKGLPVLYIAGMEGGVIGKFFFFNNNGHTTCFYMGAKETDYNEANRHQNNLIRTIRFYKP